MKSKSKPKSVGKSGGGKSAAEKLAELDPEFCDFLKQDDKELLEELDDGAFDAAGKDDSAMQNGDDDEKDESGSDEATLEDGENSDEDIELEESDPEDDDFVDEDEEGEDEGAGLKLSANVDKNQIRQWSSDFDSMLDGKASKKAIDKTELRRVIDEVVAALRSAVAESTKVSSDRSSRKGRHDDEENDDEDEKPRSKKKQHAAVPQLAMGAKEFHNLFGLATRRMIPAFVAYLGSNKKLRAQPLWSSIKLSVRIYFETLTDLLKTSDAFVVESLLRDLNSPDTTAFLLAVPAVRKVILPVLVSSIWSRTQSTELLELSNAILTSIVRSSSNETIPTRAFRRLYRDYVAASKFPPPTKEAAELENRRSTLLATFVVDTCKATAYSMVFMRVRALCGHIRAAMSASNPDTRATSAKIVLSWSFRRCLYFCTEAIAHASSAKHPASASFAQLVHPLSQAIFGTALLQKSPRYYPLRLHCIRMLNRLADATGTFLPTLSLILDAYSSTDFNAYKPFKSKKKLQKKEPKDSGDAEIDDEMDPNEQQQQGRDVDMDRLSHFSESYIRSTAHLSQVVNKLLYEATFETLVVYAHRIAFPELVVPLLIRMKRFLKVCRIVQFVTQLRPLLTRIEENIAFIETRRNNGGKDLHPANSSVILAWEVATVEAGPPLTLMLQRQKRAAAMFKRRRHDPDDVPSTSRANSAKRVRKSSKN